MGTTATTTSAVTASGVASRRSIASRRAHRGGRRATTAAAARDDDDDGPAVVTMGRRPRVHRARRARTRAASEEEIQRIRERMYDFDDGEIGLEAFGRASRDGGAATTTTTTLGGATRFARSSIGWRSGERRGTGAGRRRRRSEARLGSRGARYFSESRACRR